MFGFFRAPDVTHPELGLLEWKDGCWRGEIAFPDHGKVPLILGGTRKGPDQAALSQAIAVPSTYREVRGRLETALFEHYQPYAEAVRAGDLESTVQPFPEVRDATDALLKAKLEAVLIIVLDGELAVELCYNVPWDEEHTLGARFRGNNWIELCGSTLVP